MSEQSTSDAAPSLELADQTPSTAEFRAAVIKGLSAGPKTLPTRFLYDQRGSELFDEICRQPEYYPTRCEIQIMDGHARDMAACIGPDALVVEYGSGASIKTRALLDHLDSPAAYVPLDISREFLLQAAEGIAESYPDVEVLPLAADFTKPFEIPEPSSEAARTVVYFPGSTIGNFTREQAQNMLRRIAGVIGADGGLLIGVDLRKDPAILEPAYNDAAGVTAAFILNILTRMQRELGARLDPAGFSYKGVWNDELSRIELAIYSRKDQTIAVDGREFSLADGERIVVEYSHKFDDESFGQMAAVAGLRPVKHWTDPAGLFSVRYLER